MAETIAAVIFTLPLIAMVWALTILFGAFFQPGWSPVVKWAMLALAPTWVSYLLVRRALIDMGAW